MAHFADISCPQSSTSTSSEALDIPELGVQPPSSPTSSLDKPISAGIHRRRDSGPPNHGDPTKLTPQRAKHLKMHAKKACEENDVPEEDVMTFINSGDIFYMLIDLKITLVKLCQGNKARRLQELKDALESKDFENGLYNRLFACILSPNLTAYVTDTQSHIMDFIGKNRDIFKIPPGLLEDVELRSQLGKVVTKLLTNIRSSIKTTLTTSIVKCTSIADVTRSLARSRSGMEVDSTHWNRIALLRRLLRIFLISVSDYKTASIKYLFSPYLIPSLKQDLRDKVARELDIDVKQLERDIFEGDFDDVPETDVNPSQTPTETQVNTNHAPSARRDIDVNVEQFADESGMQQDANGEDEESDVSSGANSVVLLDNPLDSGFRLAEGMAVRYNSTTKFWNFVDHSLSIMRKISVESSPIVTEQDKELQKLFIEIFQADLAEFPGGKKVSKLISKTNPRWQTAIQTGLIW
ncbi:uncharacterized protein EDB93DRAFT_1247117 [Suillus bovinus]|uniref:uncharacterized protein n=1 Tax=Suillus bovinus TaxID=48563 RepID=UPI001B867E5E|nr:uncharacterized protein EDB93DRAFT_1247110 [Suillus bovinus]XP_041311274.1 uncharacterized protein EDB93DRAFT_1247117 [Suillus bovinus]KAG2156929.1 hypothetical protein EDB93DRAFT_1247110 [Suillus bovinus]KAG2156937.1 hypothetical protein EDB93DRAFT_1247117 [Suillus bovinus]